MNTEYIILKEFFEDPPDPNLDVDPEPEPVVDDKKYSKEDMDKAIARRQAALKRAKNAEEKLKTLEEKMTLLHDEDEFNTLKTGYDDMKTKLKELEEAREAAEIEKIENEKERERAKLQMEFAKERQSFEKELNTLKQEIEGFNQEKARLEEIAAQHRKQALNGSIMSAASKKAYNPQQIVRLIAHEFVHDDNDNKWYKEVYDSNGKLREMLTVEEYVEALR